jgi:hypothetical protein
MSADRALGDTLARADRLGLSTHLLAPGFDLDTAADLRWLAELPCRDAELLCPRTLSFARARGLLPPAGADQRSGTL